MNSTLRCLVVITDDKVWACIIKDNSQIIELAKKLKGYVEHCPDSASEVEAASSTLGGMMTLRGAVSFLMDDSRNTENYRKGKEAIADAMCDFIGTHSILPEFPGRFSNATGGMDLFTNIWLSEDGEDLFGSVTTRQDNKEI